MPAAEDEVPPVALNYIPEVVLKKRKTNDSWAIERKLQLQERLKRRKPDNSFIKKPRQFIRECLDKTIRSRVQFMKISALSLIDLRALLLRIFFLLKNSSTISAVFNNCDVLKPYVAHIDDIFKDFTSYKVRVPVTGAIILDEIYERCLLVKGWKGTSWSFPRGKKSKDEEDHKCAIREGLEETGSDVSSLLNKDDHIEMIFGQQRVRLILELSNGPGPSEKSVRAGKISTSFIYPIVWVSSFIYPLENARRREGRDFTMVH
ncbi:mRNA-decapping enzyme subunit 2 [Phtheirospermum japonicum]|uniref:mRNA-decapping enzyme subunit 2 n=1 Tax=Phtheirospermum japonicum TaxID=374723 RepID=A0A830D7Z5_9LAMI|nr:mRNA-decapping enzyme subunit 2 [Phtheirospermum japonicum]